jgi:peptidylprolyl isomerase/FKBP-type peptidyl-prolyl cis-trans isomerase FklB
MRLFVPILASLALLAGLSACAPSKQAAENLDAAAAFMAKNAKVRGVKTLPSGVQYKVVKAGPATGVSPKVVDEVKVHYEGKLLSGLVFDSSFQRGTPATFPLRGLIPAWTEALQLMKPGDEWLLYVPPALGYGAQGAGPIPPNSVMVFRIQLIDVMPHPAPPAG